MKRKIVNLLVMMVIVLFVTACGSSGNAGKESGTSKSENNKTEKQENNETEKQEEVTLSMMVTTRPTTDDKDFYLDYLPELVKEKFPHIDIEVEQLPTDHYNQTVKLKFINGEGPDMFTWWAGLSAKELVDAGYVRDLSDFSQLGKFNQDVVNSYTFDGKSYAIPNGTSFLTTWYNQDAFAEVGIDGLPQNWDEFLEACEKLKNGGYTPITMGDKQSFVIQFGMYQIGASAVYGDNIEFDNQLFTGETKFTDDVWVETVSKYKELYDKGYVIENSLGLSQEQSRQAFLDGKAAMIFDGSFGYDALNTQGAVEFEKDMFCIPSNEKGENFVYNLTPSTGVFVSKDSKRQEAIDDVLEYWFTEGTPLFDKWVEKNMDISAYEGVEDVRPMVQGYLERYKGYQSIYNLNNAWPEGVSDTMCTKFQEVITGHASPEDVTQAMQDKFEELVGK